MTWVALNWAVIEFTGSALYLGLINACRLVPAFLLSIPAGVLADRSDRRKMLILLQAGTMLSTFCVGYLLAVGSTFWLLAVVVTLRSVLMAAVIPVRNTLIPNLVPESQVASAVAIDTAVRNLARIAGPAIAGVLLAVMEVADVFGSAGAASWPCRSLYSSLTGIQQGWAPTKREHESGYQEAALYVKKQPVRPESLDLAVVTMVFAFLTPL